MANQGSYHISSFSTGITAEIKRLDAQIDLFWKKEIDCYRRLGIMDGTHIVDIGSGTGHLIELLSAEFLSSRFTGIEQDRILVDFSRNRLTDHRNVSEIIHSDIEAFDAENQRFDVVLMRLVLEHVPRPEIALHKVRSMLKPGGIFVVVDNDFNYHLRSRPDVPELEDLYAAYRASRLKDGGDPSIGRRLPQLLEKVGFADVDLEIICAHNQLVGDRAFLNAEGGGIPAQLVKSGFFEAQQFDALVKHWNDMLQKEDHVLFRQLFVAKGRMPKDGDSPRVDGKTSTGRPNASPITEKEKSVRALLAEVVCNELGLSLDELDASQSLIDAGLDSGGALDVQMTVEKALGVHLKISYLIGGLTFSDLVAYVETQMTEAGEEAVASGSNGDEGESGSV